MYPSLSFLAALFAVQVANGALNEPCYGTGDVPGSSNLPLCYQIFTKFSQGVCVLESTCASNGGATSNGGCPKDPANVKCCTKAHCGDVGNCRWNSDCAGSSASNQCPGPSAFKCCQSSAPSWGGYPAPSFPSTSSGCKQVAIDGAKWVVDKWPGRVRQIYCIRDCACGSNPSSDHCCGKAIDFMCSDAGGTATLSGREVAEWIMKNRNGHNIKYIIWGQRIWAPSDGEKSWEGWRPMEDRHGITENHWSVPHNPMRFPDILTFLGTTFM